jgi:hypothetical protein
MSDKDFIQDGLTNEKIVETIKELRKRKDEDDCKSLDEMTKYEKLKKEFEFFSDRYPMLYDMCLRDGEFDWSALNYFLNMRTKVINNRMTTEEASVKVGKEWFDKFVDVDNLNKAKDAKKQRKS